MGQAIFHRETGEFLGELLAEATLPSGTHLRLPVPSDRYDPEDNWYLALYRVPVDVGIMHTTIAEHWILAEGTKEDLWRSGYVSPPARIRGRMAP